jgi:Repeat of Unknown Function (DUF347)
LSEILAFWAAFILTRPLGASIADWMAVEPHRGGLGLGVGGVALVSAVVIADLVRHLSVSRIDVRDDDHPPAEHDLAPDGSVSVPSRAVHGPSHRLISHAEGPFHPSLLRWGR